MTKIRSDRKWKNDKERRALKAEYDREYRRKNRELLKVKKAAYFQKTYDPVKAAIERKKRMPYHVEYCRQPEYKKKKQIYDHNRMHGRYKGEWIKTALILDELQKEIRRQMPDRFERYKQTARKQWSPLTQLKRRIKRGINSNQSLGI